MSHYFFTSVCSVLILSLDFGSVGFFSSRVFFSNGEPLGANLSDNSIICRFEGCNLILTFDPSCFFACMPSTITFDFFIFTSRIFPDCPLNSPLIILTLSPFFIWMLLLFCLCPSLGYLCPSLGYFF